MKRAPLITGFLLSALLLLGLGGLYLADRSEADVLADGIEVNDVAVGGLTPNQARLKLEAELLRPLDRPVTVTAAGRRYRLTPEQAGVAMDLDAMVRAAEEASRDGNFVTRGLRSLTGGEVDRDLTPQVTYDRGAVSRLVRRIEREVERDPRDAEVSFGAGEPAPVASQDGRRLRAQGLADEIGRALLAPSGTRAVRARVQRVAPDVTTDELAQRYPVVLYIDRDDFRIKVFRRLKLDRTYPIAVGQVGLETPAGLYNIQNKAVDPAWHVPNSDWAGDLAGQVIPGGAPDNPIKSRWMGIYDGVGIHGTDARGSIGTRASHGCIRMLVEDVQALYDIVPVGAPVYIA